jgi:hypothetical protein
MITFAPWKRITSSTLEYENIQEFKKDNIYTMKNWKMITSSTLENDNIQAFKNDNIYTIKNENILYPGKLYSFSNVM